MTDFDKIKGILFELWDLSQKPENKKKCKLLVASHAFQIVDHLESRGLELTGGNFVENVTEEVQNV